MKNKNTIDSFNNAVNGIIYVLKHERNMKVHIITAVGVLIASLFFKLSRIEFLILCLTIALVLVSELLNTAIEILVDIIVDVYHPKAKAVKDIAAGAVLMASFVAVIVAYFIFFDRISSNLEIGFKRVGTTKMHITIIALIITIIVVLVTKTFFKKGTPFYGGMPSGHAAISISLATAITFLTDDIKITILSYFIAFMVLQSRLEAKIHTIIELLFGGFIGFLITVLLFEIFNK